MEADQSEQQHHEQGHQHHHHHHHHVHHYVAKDGRSRTHRIIRDRVVGSKWFGRFIMFITIVNAIVLWPWTDLAKSDAVQHRGHVEFSDVYPVVNWFFIAVYVTEFVLKVCYCPG